MCLCHPFTREDQKIWDYVRKQPNTREEWQALHDAIEDWKRMLIDNEKTRRSMLKEQT